MGRYQDLVALDGFSSLANTDIFTDITIQVDGILRIGVETLAVEDVRITLDGGTNFTTLLDTAADIWAFLDVPVRAGDVFNMQTVGAETISIRVILDQG